MKLLVTISSVFLLSLAKKSIFNQAQDMLDKVKENAELEALEGIVDEIDDEWDAWIENLTEEEKENDPYGLGFIDELEAEYIESTEEMEVQAISLMSCG